MNNSSEMIGKKYINRYTKNVVTVVDVDRKTSDIDGKVYSETVVTDKGARIELRFFLEMYSEM